MTTCLSLTNSLFGRSAIAAAAAAAIAAGAAGFAPQADAAGLLTPVGQSNPLEIRDHAVSVLVEDGYATTTIEQVFVNPSSRDLEAVYAFPVPDDASVAEFTYWIDGAPVVGDVVERDKARKIYEGEKAAGRETALAEQIEIYRFEMSVWPVPANGESRIRMTYVQPTHLDSGVGRYVYPLEEGGTDDRANAFWTANEAVTGQFSFDMTVRMDAPVDAIRVPTHPGASCHPGSG